MEKNTVSKILVVDDHTLLRETWSFIINDHKNFKVVAATGTGQDAISLARQFRPDVVMMDIGLPDMSGMEATTQILKILSTARVLGVSIHNHPTYARKMMEAGAYGYITKNSPREEMFKALAEVSAGRKYICNEIKNILSQEIFGGSSPDLTALSTREMEIVRYLKIGSSSREIADALEISQKTVEVHRSHILKKLNLKNTAALVNFVNRHQL